MANYSVSYIYNLLKKKFNKFFLKKILLFFFLSSHIIIFSSSVTLRHEVLYTIAVLNHFNFFQHFWLLKINEVLFHTPNSIKKIPINNIPI
jgi:hypothetical protein